MKIVDEFDGIYVVDTEVGGEKGIIFSFIVVRDKVAIVESGPESTAHEFQDIFDELSLKPENVEYIAVTHVHLDHGGGAGSLSEICKNAKVLVHPKGEKHLVNPEKLWNASKSVLSEIADVYGEPKPLNSDRIIATEDMLEVSLGNSKIKVVHTPGHAPHHQSYVLDDKVLFSGDSAGVYKDGKIIPTTPPIFDVDKALQSIDRMASISPEKIAFTHFDVGGGEQLAKIREKLLSWKSIAESCETVEEMHEKLLEVDEDYKYFWNWLKDSKFAESYFHLALRGLMEAVRK